MALEQTRYRDLREEEISYEEERGRREAILAQTPAWLVSMAVHTALLLTLALLTVGAAAKPDPQIAIDMTDPVMEEFEDEFPIIDPDIFMPEETPIEKVDDVRDPELATEEVVAPGPSEEDASPPEIVLDTQIFEPVITRENVSHSIHVGKGEGLGSRDWKKIIGDGKDGGKDPGDGREPTPIGMGLHWIAEHQYASGGWNFNHTAAPRCQGKCRNAGSYHKAVNGATAMGILPFLGCGVTHKSGPAAYKKTVGRGLYFLVKRMKPDGSFHEEQGTMYSHGLAAICLTEAYAMTRDPALRVPAQGAVNFIVQAQDPVGGGWRYQPRQQGDTSVVGWQLMALKSGYMAYLRVPQTTPDKAMRFLDTVQANGGANYGYLTPSTNAGACTAIGLLSRMYYGWDKEHPALAKGVEWLGRQGPSQHDMYYNYYASQVMHHYGGSAWRKWDGVMREMLVSTQVRDKNSHEYGSWYTSAGHDHGKDSGGRLYKTSLAVMTLEVYYRYSPIYKAQSLSGGLEL